MAEPSVAGWPALAARGIDLASLGAAYLVLIVNVLFAAAAFVAARRYLVVSPNRGAKDYALYAAVVPTVLLVATVLENELLPAGTARLHYVALPHLLVLLGLHVALYRRVEPLLVVLAASASAGALATIGAVALATDLIHHAHAVAALALALLLGWLAWRSVSTKRAYVRSSSIYVESKEDGRPAAAEQVPWLGLKQWLALGGATVGLCTTNAVLKGVALAAVPMAPVALEALLLLGVTVAVTALPAGAYWIARRAWMPELTRFVWLVWLIVGFTFTYGNYLARIG